jgi:hypothetical protein
MYMIRPKAVSPDLDVATTTFHNHLTSVSNIPISAAAVIAYVEILGRQSVPMGYKGLEVESNGRYLGS